MAHYSSQLLCYEDEIKKSLKGISMKPLVFASYAQFGVDAEDERYRALVMAYDPRPSICGDLFLLQTYTYRLMDLLRNRIEPVLWRKLCAV